MGNLYEEYASVDAQIKALELKKEQLRPHIISMMEANKVDKVETSLGKFSITNLKKWSYSDVVEKMADELKAQKAKEESTGEATFDEVPSLRFTSSKL
jgi:hypothetical protein